MSFIVTMDTRQNELRILKFAQDLLLSGDPSVQVTPSAIIEQIDRVLSLMPAWGSGVNKELLVDELVRRFSMWIGVDNSLSSNLGHVPWLESADKSEWRYWQRYSDWLGGKMSWQAVDRLDQSTSTILGFLENPAREGQWDRRGLVVGHVQSGKTGNYTGLICKAADAGYKIIVVLAGLHNNLRSQTQIRLEEGFLGYAKITAPGLEHFEYVGVGTGGLNADIRPNCATNRSDTGDFNRRVARHLAVSPEQRPWLFVVKKNKSVLTDLLDWIQHHVANTIDAQTGQKRVGHLPLLVIDDEADNASVDTGEQSFDADGNPDEEHEPKAINRLIRRILHSFSRSAYVGFTATPFANIFIHEKGATLKEGPDLFPSAFILNLAAPSNYVGPAAVFGLASQGSERKGLPLVREVSDQEHDAGQTPWMPIGHKRAHAPQYLGQDVLPPSLVEAIDSFLLSCAARRLRGQERKHSSMLIHVTRFNDVQRLVFGQVNDHVRHLRQRILRKTDDSPILERLHALYLNDFAPTTASVRASWREPPEELKDWRDVVIALEAVCEAIEVRTINGTAKDALDYEDHEDTGLTVIAIGGDKLSRGLTLEGLCCSYFLRSSRMYDTLMQMGRWFGYRPGYVDLCRLYTTAELTEWFCHIADASEELREEFDVMAERKLSPKEYGLKVQSHPLLMVTSPLKMRTAQTLYLSFSGQLQETIVFHRDSQTLARNLQAARTLLENAGAPDQKHPTLTRGGVLQSWPGAYLWNRVAAQHVVSFLDSYRTHPAAHKVNSAMLSEFVRSLLKVGELTHWTVALVGGGDGAVLNLAPDVSIPMNTRTDRNTHDDRYSIGRLLDPKDESIDLDEQQWVAALELTRSSWKPDPARNQEAEPPKVPNGPAMRHIKGLGAEHCSPCPERGLLVIYALDPGGSQFDFDGTPEAVVGFGISFPDSESGQKVEYKATTLLWEQQYGAGA